MFHFSKRAAGTAFRVPRKARQTLAVGLVGFCAFLSLYSTQPLLPLFHQIFHASKLAVSLTVSAATLAVAISAPFVGIVADRVGRKKVIIPSIYLLAVANLLTAFSPNLPVLIGWRFVQGVLTPAVFAVAVAYINEEWEPAETGFATSVYVTGTVVGGFCGRFLSGLVASRWNWPWVFVCLGLLNLGLAALASAWLPPARHFKGVADYASGLRGLAGHFRNRSLLVIYAVGFTLLFSLVGSFTYITFYLAEPPFNLSTTALGAIFAVYLVGAVVTPVAGTCSNRRPGWVILSLALLFAMGGMLGTLTHNLWLVILGITLCSSGVFVCQIITNRNIGAVAGGARASAVGLYVTFYYCGGFVGSVVPGFLWDLGGWPLCVAFIAGVQGAALLFVLLVWRRLECGAPEPAAQAVEAAD